MLKYAFGTIVLVLFLIASFVFWRTGYYKEVTIGSGELGPFYLVYKEHLGPYHKIPPVIESVEKAMDQIGNKCPFAFGRYLDDPEKVDHDRLRSHGGCAFASPLSHPVDASQFKEQSLSKQEYVIATFNGSPSVGPFKVYPKVDEWFKKYGYKQKGPVVELYQTLEDGTVLTKYLFKYE